jgi:hypothetical protein
MKPLASRISKILDSTLTMRVAQRSRLLTVLITLIGNLSLWPFSGGEDVANARENMLTGEKIDFWGGFSQLFYSSFKMDEPIWHIVLGLIHSTLILLGTLISLKNLDLATRKNASYVLLVCLHFVATIYVLNLSRDGTLLAFAWIGTSLTLRALHKRSFGIMTTSLGISLLIIGLAFRPWLAVAFIPFVITMLYRTNNVSTKSIRILVLLLVSILLSAGPLVIDLGSKKLLNLKDSYPEQQVMILDLASVACLSPEKSAQSFALESLQPISTSPVLDRERLCGQYYPQSWASLVFYSNPSDPALRMIATEEFITYKKIRASWINLITNKPTQYLQVKTFQVAQLFLAGDSVQLFSSSLRQIPLIPYELMKAFRIFSFLPILLLFSWITFSSRIQIDPRVRWALFSTYLIAISIVTVAFIGDNQRYISWLAMLLLFANINAPRNLEKVRNS